MMGSLPGLSMGTLSQPLFIPLNAPLISFVSCLFGLKRRDMPQLFLFLKGCLDNDTVILILFATWKGVYQSVDGGGCPPYFFPLRHEDLCFLRTTCHCSYS